MKDTEDSQSVQSPPRTNPIVSGFGGPPLSADPKRSHPPQGSQILSAKSDGPQASTRPIELDSGPRIEFLSIQSLEEIEKAIGSGFIPNLLELGGEEEFEAYQDAFNRIILARRPIIDPKGREIVFNDDACRHVCFREERADKGRKRHENKARIRDEWDQSRAKHIPWIVTALTDPSEIVFNKKYPGNEVYLLGFPRNDPNRPGSRYYVSVKPIKGGQRLFKTAYPIDQYDWDDARRGVPGTKHVQYKRIPRRY